MWRKEEGIDTWGDPSPTIDEQNRRNSDRDKDEAAAGEIGAVANASDDETKGDGDESTY